MGASLGPKDEEMTTMVEPWRALVTEYLALASAEECGADDGNQTRMNLRQYQSVSEEVEVATLPSTLRRR